MIVSASYRTDIPAFRADWFRARLAEGFCIVGNPYGGRPYRVDLSPRGADGFVFWTRNAAPFADALQDVTALNLPFVVQFTVTGYPRLLDARTPRADDAAEQIAALSRKYGRRAVVWRYDPVIVTSATPPAWHARNFAALAARLAGTVDECTVSFAHVYRKTRRRLDRAAQLREFTWRDPEEDERREICRGLAAAASDFGMRLTVCSQPETTCAPATPARCIDAGRLSDVAGRDIAARQKGNRAGCLCAESRDIGAYDTCAHGCVYCYAVSDHDRAAARLRGLLLQDRGGEVYASSGSSAADASPGSDALSAGGSAGSFATATLAGLSKRS